MVFQGLLPQMKSDLYKIFTSDALQGNASYILRLFKKCYKFLEIQPKTEFQAHFWKFFDYILLRPFPCAQIFIGNERPYGDVQSW